MSTSFLCSHFDFDKQEFVTSEDDRVYTMPRNAACEVLYCNIEGVQWLDDDRLVIASDKAKADQPYPCTLKVGCNSNSYSYAKSVSSNVNTRTVIHWYHQLMHCSTTVTAW